MKVEDLPKIPGAEIFVRMPDGEKRQPTSQVLLGNKLLLVVGPAYREIWKRSLQERRLLAFIEWVEQQTGNNDLNLLLEQWLDEQAALDPKKKKQE